MKFRAERDGRPDIQKEVDRVVSESQEDDDGFHHRVDRSRVDEVSGAEEQHVVEGGRGSQDEEHHTDDNDCSSHPPGRVLLEHITRSHEVSKPRA